MQPAPLPWQHGPVAVLTDALLSGTSALDASDTGTGKTMVALFAAKAAKKTVGIICPKSVIPSWEEAAAAVGVPVVFVANIERLKARGHYLTKSGWKIPNETVLIFDEVHRFGGQNTANAKALAFAPMPVLMLSATAAGDPTKLRAIGSQLGLTTWADWWRWCGRNGCKKGHFGGIQFRGTAEDLDRLHRQIFHTGRGVRVRVADLGDAFPHTQHIFVSVPVENQRAIDEAYAADLEKLKTGVPLFDLIRSRQIAEHEKLAAVAEMVEDDLSAGKSVAIFVNFRDSLEFFAREFNAPTIDGSQNSQERQECIAVFKSGKARVIVCMIQAGGCGLDGLQDLTGEAPRVGYLFPGYSAVDIIQALGRLPRANAKSHVIYRWIFAAGTVETNIRRKIEKKRNRIDLLNDGDLTTETPTPINEMKNESPNQGVLLEVPATVTRVAVDVPTLHGSRAHAKISPSKLKSKEVCPAYDDDRGADIHPDTAQGTLCHEALDAGDDSKLTTDDQRAWVKMCRQFASMLTTQYPQVFNEVKLDVVDGMWGFADRIQLSKGRTVGALLDWKFGANLQEDVATNPAAQAYVLGMFKKWVELQSVEVFYIYPRREEISTHRYERTDMAAIELRVRTIVARAEAPLVERHPHPSVCTWCMHNSTCPVLHAAVLPIATRYAAAHTMAFPESFDLTLIKDPITWQKLMQVSPVLEAMADSIKRHALEFRTATGQEIPGFEMRQRTGRKTINNALLTYQIVSKEGVTQQQFLSAVDVSAKRLADAVGETAAKGQKSKRVAEIEGKLRDAGVLEVGQEVFYLTKTK